MSQPVDRPAISGSPLSVLLLSPKDNSDEEEVVAAWDHFLDGLKRDYEVLVASEGDQDQSDSPAGPRVVRLMGNPGPGAAFRAGIAAARFPLLCCTACSKEFQPADLNRFLAEIDKVDVVTGYRVWRALPLWLIWLDRIQRLIFRLALGIAREPRQVWLGWRGLGRRLLARWIFGVRVHDPECPFRLFRREIFARIPIQCETSFAHVEVLAKANFLGCWMSEVPVTCLPSARGTGIPAAGATRLLRKEVFELFRRPDFGPADVKGTGSATTTQGANPPEISSG